jgi:hypothetical protein
VTGRRATAASSTIPLGCVFSITADANNISPGQPRTFRFKVTAKL